MAMRLAAGIPSLMRALKGVFPVPKTGMDYMNYGLRLGPEVLGAAMAASSLPPDADAGTRGLAGLEELATSLLLSTGGSMAGRGIASRQMQSQLKSGKFNVPEGMTRRQAYDRGLDMGTSLGDAAMMPLQWFGPRPFRDHVVEEYLNQQSPAEAVEGREQQETNDMMIAALLASGALGGTSMVALDAYNPRRAVLDING